MSLSIKEQRKLNKVKEKALERLLTKVRHHVLTDGLIKEFLSIDDLPVGSVEKLAASMANCYGMTNKYALKKIKELQTSVNRKKYSNRDGKVSKLESELTKALKALTYFKEEADKQAEKINRINDELLSFENGE